MRKLIIKRFSYWGFIALGLGIVVLSRSSYLKYSDFVTGMGMVLVIAGAMLISEALEAKQ